MCTGAVNGAMTHVVLTTNEMNFMRRLETFVEGCLVVSTLKYMKTQ